MLRIGACFCGFLIQNSCWHGLAEVPPGGASAVEALSRRGWFSTFCQWDVLHFSLRSLSPSPSLHSIGNDTSTFQKDLERKWQNCLFCLFFKDLVSRLYQASKLLSPTSPPFTSLPPSLSYLSYSFPCSPSSFCFLLTKDYEAGMHIL